jgi:hypothetical protein
MSATQTTLTVLLNMVVMSGAAGGAAGEARGGPIPSNLAVTDDFRTQIEHYWAVSPTLRRQLAVIGDARWVVVAVSVSPIALPRFRRAETTISRYDSGFLRAQVVVPPGADFIELLAHELEHVVEQIEGVDLAASVRGRQGTQDLGGFFETVRARDAGRAAASEVDEALRAAPAH